MSKRALSDRTLKALKPEPGKATYDVMDTEVPGFGVRVSDKGRRTFILIARYPGSANPTRRALGEYGDLTLEKAREKARGWRELIRKGIDPAHAEERERMAELRKQENTFGAVVEEFIRRKVRGQRKARDVEQEIRNELLPRFEHRPVTEITGGDVVRMVNEIVDRGAPYQAHNVLGHIRRFYNWTIAQQSYGIEHSPCDRLKPKELIGAKKHRQRVLDDDELRGLWRASGEMGYPFGAVYRLLLLTGQRKNEVAQARWREFDLHKKIWTIPPERFKSDAVHTVPLTDDVLALLGTLPRFVTGDHLFSTTHGAKPVSGFSKAKEQLDKRMGDVPPFVIHDIRRTVRTRLSSLKVSERTAEMVIGHGPRGLAKVYDQHRFLDEMREALELWAARLRDIVEPPPANVVELAKARA